MDKENSLPLGLAFQMSMNQSAMEHFAQLTDEEKGKVLKEARNAQSKEQMQGIVDHLGMR